MQPEEIKVNGQQVATEKKELTPSQLWDQLAFQVIYNEICPKGFRKVKNGKFRNSEYVEMPKKAVIRVQRVGAQLVRGYREMVKKQYQEKIDISRAKLGVYLADLKDCKFYEFKAKRELRRSIANLEEGIGTMSFAKNLLDQTPIK